MHLILLLPPWQGGYNENNFFALRSSGSIDDYAQFLLRESGGSGNFGTGETGQLEFVTYSSSNTIGALVVGTIQSRPVIFGTNNLERMRITGGGAVTINNLGTGTVTSSSGTLSASSDMNLKISDGYIDNALDKIMNLKPRYFYWKEETGLPTNIRQLGFYAQEVNQSLGEEAANTPKNENDKWGIYDRSIIAMLTKAMQEQQSQIDILKQEIINLKNK